MCRREGCAPFTSRTRCAPGGGAGRIPPVLRLLACLVVTGALTTGCARREKDPAVVAYERFSAAVRSARAEALWKSVTPASRENLAISLGLPREATAEEAAQILGVRPGWQFEFDLPQQARLDKTAVGEDRRVVLGPLAGRTWRIVVRKIDQAWLVDLLESEPVEG